MDAQNRKKLVSVYILIFILLFFIISFMGAYFCSIVFNVFPEDRILIKLSDSSKCMLKKYSFEMREMTVSFSASQFNIIKLNSGDRLLLDIPVVNTAPEKLTYWVRAEYENCPEIKSEPRVVERGYIIYESIFNDQINFSIRAK